jgi:alpha-L-glutamate ligase-like protein
LCVVARHREIQGFPQAVKDHDQFVVKPAGGSQGRGILVVAGRDGSDFVGAQGARIPRESLACHLSAILAGLYHAGGQPDRALVEQRVPPHPVFQHIAAKGTPDIRVVLYRRVPVMAMLRLPTSGSQGRANLHQGGMAAGIDLRDGRTFGGVWRGLATDRHPDTGCAVAGLEIPCWKRLLSLAMQLADCLALDYLGIDFLLDAALGPVVLEANARPGLAIQIANGRGLIPKLCTVEAHAPETLTPGDRRSLPALLVGSNDM